MGQSDEQLEFMLYQRRNKMLIPIKRMYLSGIEEEIMVNTRYIVEITPTHDEDKPKTKIVKDSFNKEGADVIYTNEPFPSIKAKITKISKLREE